MAKQTNPTPAPEPASTSDVTFSFVKREDGPERLVCEAELVFPATAGILAGLKLVGLCYAVAAGERPTVVSQHHRASAGSVKAQQHGVGDRRAL
jgi:hypothetical protein